MARHGLFRRRWLLLRWLGLRWERRLAWFVLLLFGAGPIVLSATLLWYVRSGRLARAFESQLAVVLGSPVKIEGLQVTGWHWYAIAQLTLFGGPEGSRPLLRAEKGTVSTGQRTVAVFLRGTVDLGSEDALNAWRQVLVGPTTGAQSESELGLAVESVSLARDVPGVRLPPGAKASLKGGIAITPGLRFLALGGSEPAEPPSLGAESGGSLTTLFLSPPGLLGVERLATNLGWPAAVLPADLHGNVVMLSEGSLRRGFGLHGEGGVDLAEVAPALGLPACSGKVTVTIDLDLVRGLHAGGSHGTVSVALAGSDPAKVDALALEVFRYIFFGQLSDRPVEEDVYTLDRIAFTVTLASDRVTVTGEDGPLLSGRSQRGYTIELSGPAQATTEELARRVRLALGGLPPAGSPEAGESRLAPPAQ